MEPADHDALPSGTVTFLLTDIEDSSGQWEASPGDMRRALSVHDEIVGQVVKDHGGVVVKHMGDGCWAVFASAPRAADAAIVFQRRHQTEAADLDLTVRVRIGLHTGDIEPTEGDYFGPVVNRAARVVDLANGDQMVCSSSTAGLLPDVELRAEGLHELRGIGDDEIFMVLAEGVVTDPQALRRPVKPTNLPRPQTSFFGRDDDVARARAFIDDGEALVTLLGPGGVGKTRLATEVARSVSAAFDEHLYFCDLVPIADGDAEAVAEAVAEVVGARRQPGMTLVESVADHLSGRPSLILIDNCEHVMVAVRALTEALTTAAGVQVLTTSREPLGLPGEQRVIVEPLPASSGAVDLFVDRARHRDDQFELGPDNEAAVHAIIERLDGIPLAIELAAARIRLMTPSELVERLEDGFRVLGRGGGRDRHETLQETVRWSYELLDPVEAALFRRLCVFAGGFDLEAVEAVCADDEVLLPDDIPDLLLALVDKSMVVSTKAGGKQRFTLLETLQAFAADELAASDPDQAFQGHHADYYRALAATQGRRFWTAAEPDAWRILDAEWTNLRTAMDTYQAVDELDQAADLVISVYWYANTSMRFEVFHWADELLAAPGIDTRSSYTSLCGASALGRYFTVHGDPLVRAEAGLAVDPTDPDGLCHTALAAVAMNNLQDLEMADGVTRDWLATDPATPGGRLWAECFRIFYLSTYDPGPEADERAETAMSLAEECDSTTAKALTSWARGQAMSYHDMDEGMSIWHEGLEWARSLPGDHIIEHLLDGLILHMTVRRDDLATSLRGCRHAVAGALERHYHAGTSHLFGVTAIALSRAGDAQTGARLVGAMLANGHAARRNARRTLEEALGDDLDAHLALGEGLTITEAGHLAVDALDTAIDQLEAQPA